MWTSIYASRRITIPIKALAEATGKLAEGGYGHRVDISATDEVGRLIESFNQMSTQLAQQRQAVTETNLRLDGERAYFLTVLDSVSTGIIVFTDALELLSINQAALHMLQLEGYHELWEWSVRDLEGRIEASLIGRNVAIGRSPALPKAYRFVVGDNAEIAIL